MAYNSCFSFGSANLDIVSSVEKIAKEDEKIKIKEYRFFCGGSCANTSIGLKKLGFSVEFHSKVANDIYGKIILEDLKLNGINTKYIKIIEGRTSFTFIALTENGNRAIYSYKGDCSIINPNEIPPKIKKDIVFTAGLDERSIPAIIKAFSSGNLNIFAPSSYILAYNIEKIVSLSDIIILNRIEWNMLRRHQYALSNKLIVITDSKGKITAIKDQEKYEITPFHVETVDTTGAGDAFCAGFIYGYISEYTIEDCLKLGAAMAALNIQKIGGHEGMPNLKDLKLFLKNRGVDII